MEKEKREFQKKHNLVKIIIYLALLDNVRERIQQDKYNRLIHKEKQVVEFTKKVVKLISGNMDYLYNT